MSSGEEPVVRFRFGGLPRGRQGRSVALLSLCWGLTMMGNMFLLLIATQAGRVLAEDKDLQTLPFAVGFIALALSTMPASQVMKRFGRRRGFVTGAVIGIAGALVSAYSVYSADFWMLCVGVALLGAYNAFNLLYRFAAAEVVSPALRGQAISLVLAGGIIAALIGPELAKLSIDLYAPVTYVGSFLFVILFAVGMIVTVQFISFPEQREEELTGTARPMAEIARQPRFLIAILGGMIGQGVMVLLMTATPLAMVAHDLAFADTAFVVQWHVLGMYLPSFFTGAWIGRFGAPRVMMAGAALQVVGAAIALGGVDLLNFIAALILVGVGWNFLFVGATTMLTETYAPAEMAKVQGFNDFFVFGTVAVASLSAGALLNLFGWTAVALATLPMIAVVMVGILWLRWATAPSSKAPAE